MVQTSQLKNCKSKPRAHSGARSLRICETKPIKAIETKPKILALCRQCGFHSADASGGDQVTIVPVLHPAGDGGTPTITGAFIAQPSSYRTDSREIVLDVNCGSRPKKGFGNDAPR